MTSLRTLSIVCSFSLTLAAATGCHKDEAKSEPAAPADTTVTTTGGAPPQVQVQTVGTSVKINPAAAPIAQAPAVPKPGAANKVILRADDGRTVKVGEKGVVELKAADGRTVHGTAGDYVAEDPSRPGVKVHVSNGNVDLSDLSRR